MKTRIYAAPAVKGLMGKMANLIPFIAALKAFLFAAQKGHLKEKWTFNFLNRHILGF